MQKKQLIIGRFVKKKDVIGKGCSIVLIAKWITQLPENLIVAGTTYCVAGIEIPHDYSGKVIDDCEIIDLEECDMMFFQSETFENDSDFGTAIDEVNKAIRTYNPKQYGYRFALDLAPRFNYGASKEIGAKQAIPVQKI